MSPLNAPLPICSIDKVIRRPLSFLWPGRLPYGKLAILDGDPGLGKSLVTLDLCARLSTGRALPDGAPCPGQANSIILNAEDAVDDTIEPRLRALGADLARIFVVHSAEEPDQLPLHFPGQIAVFDQMLTQTQARLVILDPIVAYLDPSVQISNDASIRRALHALALLAEKHQCVIIMVRHLNKTGDQHSIYRGGGSIGFLAACRTAWLIAADPDKPAQRVLAQLKNNIAPPQPSLAYEIIADDGQPPAIFWNQVARSITSDQLLAKVGRGPVFDSVRARSRDFLTSFLEAGPQRARDIWKAAEEIPLGKSTLKKAKEDLNIRAIRVVVDGTHVSYWLLPGQELPNSIPSEAIVPDLEEWLAPLRKNTPHPPPSTTHDIRI